MLLKLVSTTFIASILLLLTSAVKADDESGGDPAGFSSTGKFFYSQVYYQPDDFQHYYVQMKLGCHDFQQKWVITTQEESVGYVTTICNQTRGCEVPDKFPWAVNDDGDVTSDECVSNVDQFIMNETARLNDGTDTALQDPIPNFQLQGYSAKNRLTFTMADYNRQTVIDMKSFAIQQSNGQVFTSQHYSGYLGLAPYSSNTSIQYESILYHLKHENKIDHVIVSLFMRDTGKSSIKFGSYDKAALLDYKDFTVVKTVSKDSWAIAAIDPLVNGKTIQLYRRDIDFLIDPQLSMIYIPEDDYNLFIQHAKEIFKDDIDCSSAERPCVFAKSCEHQDIQDKDIPFQITVQDEATKEDLHIKKENLLIKGNLIGLDDQCFLSVYKYPKEYPNQSIYYFGSPFLQQNYVSLSMEPWINGEGDYLKVGIGPICETAYLGELQYDENYIDYDPQTGDISQSTSNAKIQTDTSTTNDCAPVPLPHLESSNKSATAAILGTVGGLILITVAVVSVYIYRKRKAEVAAAESGNLKTPVGHYGINTRGESVGNGDSSVDVTKDQHDNEEGLLKNDRQ